MIFTDHFTKPVIPNLGLVRFPNVDLTQDERVNLGLKPTADNKTILKHITWNGVKALRAKGYFKGFSETEVIDRLKTEFATFDKTGVHDYLLLVWDFIRWADSQGIVRGWGRGSAAGSLTLFALGITKVDPLRRKLNFLRFISEARMKPVIKDGIIYVDGKSAPDIDSDFQYGRRAEVINYIETKYAGRTCKISTRLEYTGKTALKNVLKAYGGYNEDDAQRVSNLIESKFGKVQGLYEAQEKNVEIKKWLEQSELNKKIYSIALAIEGAPTGKGQHPSGVFISYNPLDGSIPTELSKEKEGVASVVTSYDMETVAILGIKVDILGVRTLDLVDGVVKEVGISIDDINVDDLVIYDYLARPTAYYQGLFQIEEGVTKDVVVKVQPKDIEGLATSLAISRPGSLRFVDQYADYSTKGVLKTIYPAIDEILKTTGNVLVFQEQITQICQEVFGLSGVDADSIRQAVGKKKKEDMAKWEPVLYQQGKIKDIPDHVTKYFWDVCNASADYLFVKNHATCYAYLCAATTYVKALYPQAYYLTMLRLSKEEADSLGYMKSVIAEATLVGIKILPPDILSSADDFSIQQDPTTGEKVIRFGLGHIKGISDKTMKTMASFRRQFSSKFEVFDAARAAEVDIRVLSSLILSGCLSWKGIPRTKLALEAQIYNLLSDTQKGKVKQFAAEYDEDIIEILRALPSRKNERGTPIIPEKQLDTLRRRQQPYWDVYQLNSKNEDLTAYLNERAYLGFSYSNTLSKIFSHRIASLVDITEVKRVGEKLKALPPLKPNEKAPRQDPLQFVGFVKWIKTGVTKKSGAAYIKMEVEDDAASTMVMLLGDERLESCKGFNGRLPDEDDLVIVSGVLSREGSLLFADSIIIQHNPIATKRSVINQEVSV